MKFVSRVQWGASARGATVETHPIGKTYGVTIHWEGPGMGQFPHTECDDKLRSIQKFHKEVREWADIAYNLVVCPHGYVFEGRGAGVKSAANGDTQPNDDWYAVCYLGGTGDGLTELGRVGLRQAVQFLRSRGAGPGVNGHRDHKATDCPGDVIYNWLKTTDFDIKPLPSRPDFAKDAIDPLREERKADREAGRTGQAARVADVIRYIRSKFLPR